MNSNDTKEKLRVWCKIVGKKIIHFRLRSEMNQEAFAKKAKVSRAVISTIENARSISLKNLVKIADALEIELPDLFKDVDVGDYRIMLDSYVRNIAREEDLVLFDLVKELRDVCDDLKKAVEKIKLAVEKIKS